jgi:ornithine cyclodeaminase
VQVVTIGPEEVRAAVPMPAAMQAVRDGFLALARGEFELPARTALRDGAFLVMSAHHRPTASAMIKTLSLNFRGRARQRDRRVPADHARAARRAAGGRRGRRR